MTIEDLLSTLPSKEDLAKAVGLQVRQPGGNMLAAIGIFGTGLLVGAGLALVFGTKLGEELFHNGKEETPDTSLEDSDLLENTESI